MRRTSAVIAALAAAVFALGCTAPTSPMDLAGRYSLVSANGHALPYLLPAAGSTSVELLEDSFVLTINGTYSETGYKRFTTGGFVVISFPVDAGNFTRRGDDVRLESAIVGLRPATISNGTLTVVDHGVTLVYAK